MRLIYYSLAYSGGSVCEHQWIQSIRSLRRYNPTIPVFLFLYTGASDGRIASSASVDGSGVAPMLAFRWPS